MRKPIKYITISTGVFTLIFFFLIREKKIRELEHNQEKFIIWQEIQKRDSINKTLAKINEKQAKEIDVIYSKNDSLMIEVSIKEIRIEEAKKLINEESTNTILYAPDSTIINILSKHNFKTTY